MKSVFITGADRGVGFALCELFLQEGWVVYAGQFIERWKELEKLKSTHKEQLQIIPLDVSSDESVRAAAKQVSLHTDCIDMLINCAGIYQDDSPEKISQLFHVNTLGPIRMVEAFLPLMQSGMKRLCFFSSEASCIALSWRKGDVGYSMSKTALNMGVKLIFNQLQPKGYTFRLYHPGHVKSYMLGDTKNEDAYYEPEYTGAVAMKQFLENRSWENVLMLTDVDDNAWPF